MYISSFNTYNYQLGVTGIIVPILNVRELTCRDIKVVSGPGHSAVCAPSPSRESSTTLSSRRASLRGKPIALCWSTGMGIGTVSHVITRHCAEGTTHVSQTPAHHVSQVLLPC